VKTVEVVHFKQNSILQAYFIPSWNINDHGPIILSLSIPLKKVQGMLLILRLQVWGANLKMSVASNLTKIQF
jgi:hypothetical protein